MMDPQWRAFIFTATVGVLSFALAYVFGWVGVVVAVSLMVAFTVAFLAAR